MAWFTDLQFSFVFDRWACDNNNMAPLYLLTAFCASVGLLGIAWSWSHWKQTGAEFPGERNGIIPRSRFLSVVGLAVNILFTIAILGQVIPKVLLHPCQ
jgi:hypothetical protein